MESTDQLAPEGPGAPNRGPDTQPGVAATQYVCCVCGIPVSPPYNLIGRRVYCDRHFMAVNKPHQGFWRSAIVQIVALGLFSAVVAVLAGFIDSVEGPWR